MWPVANLVMSLMTCQLQSVQVGLDDGVLSPPLTADRGAATQALTTLLAMETRMSALSNRSAYLYFQ